ncbi:hypothetical protein AAMO2058_001600300, partial [Amorphochlora amoebiformis]
MAGTRTSISFTVLLTLCALFVAYGGTFRIPEGRAFVYRRYTETLEGMLEVPPDKRTMWQNIQFKFYDYAMGFSFLGSGGDRRQMFEGPRDVYGPIYPYRNGIAITGYKEVATALETPQKRGPYIAAAL